MLSDQTGSRKSSSAYKLEFIVVKLVYLRLPKRFRKLQPSVTRVLPPDVPTVWKHLLTLSRCAEGELRFRPKRPSELCDSLCSRLPYHPPWHSWEDINSSTVVDAFELATERRAREWQEHERLVAEKEVLRARMEVEQKREEEQKQREEIARLRQEQVTVSKSCPVNWCRTAGEGLHNVLDMYMNTTNYLLTTDSYLFLMAFLLLLLFRCTRLSQSDTTNLSQWRRVKFLSQFPNRPTSPTASACERPPASVSNLCVLLLKTCFPCLYFYF